MAAKNPPQNAYLFQRRSTWYIRWPVPPSLRNLAIFNGKALHIKTLKTTDLHEARYLRDLFLAKYSGDVTLALANLRRQTFLEAHREATEARREVEARLPYLSDEEALDALDGLESRFNAEARHDRGDHIRADAYLAALHGKEIIQEQYAITMKDAAWDFIKEHDGKIEQAVISRAKKASESLIKFIGKDKVKLKDVTKRQVTRWIDSIRELSDSTRSGYLVALHKIWHWHWLEERVDGESPFKGNKMTRNGDESSYENFTVEEVAGLVALAAPNMRELIRYALITGCRLNELVKLTPDNFTTGEVFAVKIFEGKTKAATRTIPLPKEIWEAFKLCVDTGMWAGVRVDTWSSRFGELKKKVTGKKDRTKVFHSFRHMTSTAYERAFPRDENSTSVLIGHKRARGETMTYGLYSEGLSLQQYQEFVEGMIASPYMQQFLSLFTE